MPYTMPNIRALINILINAADICQTVADSDIDPNTYYPFFSSGTLYFNAYDKNAMVALRRAIGGQWEKRTTDHDFELNRQIDNLHVMIYTSRVNACERIVVGTETIVIPAVEAQPERTEEREIVEWQCDPILETAE